ncbi:protein-L-isoaspartate(D-aspartate) O-methyltransferase [Platysternon megacephalum]|uniref:Protein-L-isoaspartate(D-aspartate) O-methyltransferase n=1 Tax=Platysternon megacephalum TaxID=55544 RepID=A0A4D9ENL3_9SAUR|nr:protein-L-isoaspartate(D-aspartate) O-methyltransferase [Platysternon megacephalum]
MAVVLGVLSLCLLLLITARILGAKRKYWTEKSLGASTRLDFINSHPTTGGKSKMSIPIAPPEMSEQEDLKCQPSSEHQTPKPENAGSKDSPTPSSPWSPMAVVLGVLSLCLLLLIAARILGGKLILLSRQQENLIQQLENLTQQLNICQAQNANASENLQRLTQERESRFLKIDGKEELDFIKKASYQYVEDRQGLPYYFPYWIGLSYDPSTKNWVWMDGAALSSGLFHIPGGPSDNFQSGACAYFQGGNAKAGNCGETRFCICEKTKVATDQLG